MKSSSFKAEVISVAELFHESVNEPFLIPDLQRTFVWEQEVTQKFWKDMLYHQNSKKLNEMFLGTIIAFRDIAKYKIVDIPRNNELEQAKLSKIKKEARDVGIDIRGKIKSELVELK